jgi:hypothetical protein
MDYRWHLELTRKSWADSKSSHGLLVLEREASEKRGTSGKELGAECAGGRRGSGGGGEVGGSDKGKQWGRTHCGKQAGCAGVPLRTIAGSWHVHQLSGDLLFVFFNCITGRT